jgi:hypothetical protein
VNGVQQLSCQPTSASAPLPVEIPSGFPLPVPLPLGALTPVVSGALEASHVLKASAGTLYSVYASNLTGGTAGFLEVFAAASAPADGAVTPELCVPFSGGLASASYSGIPPAAFAAGITAVVSSSTTCFTKTTGVLTAFISGIVQ